MKTDYDLIIAREPQELAGLVNQKLSLPAKLGQRWHLYGSPFGVSGNDQYHSAFCQAVARDERE